MSRLLTLGAISSRRRNGVDPLAGIEGNTFTFESWRAGAALNREDTPPAHNDPVRTLLDLSDSGHHFTQSVETRQGTWKTNQLNGLPAVRTDGADDRYGVGASWSTTKTVVSILRVIADATDLGGLIGTGFDRGIRRQGASGWRSATSGDGNSGDFSNDGVMRINGAVGWELGYGEWGILVATSPTPLTIEFIAGYFPPRYLNADLVAIRCYDRELDGDEIALIESVYSAKTGITLSP